MYKQQLLQNLEREIILLKRQAAMIEPKDLDFRPGPKVRSTHELMQYLSGVGYITLSWLYRNDMPPERRAEFREKNAGVTIEDFPQRLDEQWKNIQALMHEIKEEELTTMEVELPWKEKVMLGTGIINSPIKFLTTYRMQMFWNLKLNGRDEISTKEAWVP
jgi:hypothetical protein